MKLQRYHQRLFAVVLAAAAARAGATTTLTDLEVGSGNVIQAMQQGNPWSTPTPASTNSGLFAMGSQNTIHGAGSGAIGYHNTTWTPYSMALGSFNSVGTASGSISNGHDGSMAIGRSNHAEGPGVLMVGEGNSTSFDYSWDSDDGARRMLVVGSWNSSIGHDSLIVGTNNSIWDKVQGTPYWNPASNSAVLGTGLISRFDHCTVVGKNNVGAYTPEGESPPLFIVGNGTSASARADALVVKENGDIIISKPQGDINMGIYGD